MASTGVPVELEETLENKKAVNWDGVWRWPDGVQGGKFRAEVGSRSFCGIVPKYRCLRVASSCGERRWNFSRDMRDKVVKIGEKVAPRILREE